MKYQKMMLVAYNENEGDSQSELPWKDCVHCEVKLNDPPSFDAMVQSWITPMARALWMKV